MSSAYGNLSDNIRSRDFYEQAVRVVKWNEMARGKEHDYSNKAKENQFKLIREECEELFTAAKENDRIEMLDAICDMFVVSSYGVFLSQNAVMGYDTALRRMSFREPQKADSSLSLLELEAYLYTDKNVSAIYQWSVKALCVFDANTRGGLLEVLDSNDSKFPRLVDLIDAQRAAGIVVDGSKDPIKVEAERLNKEHDGRYWGIYGTQIGVGENSELDGRVVFRDINNKIMKPLTFRPANLSSFV